MLTNCKPWKEFFNLPLSQIMENITLKNVVLDHFVLILKECECKEESLVLAPSTLGSLSYLLVACTELFLKVVTSERVIII